VGRLQNLRDDVLDFLRQQKRYLTASEAARILSKNIQTLYRHIREDSLPAKKDGGRWKIDSTELANWFEAWTTRASPGSQTSSAVDLRPIAQNGKWPRMQFRTAEERHRAVDTFISYVFTAFGKTISRTDIWRLRTLQSGEKCGYKTKSDFNAWQRGGGTKSAARYFELVLTGTFRIF
jgi:excisionase family DNA binding protein